jgi:hypothetical protein
LTDMEDDLPVRPAREGRSPWLLGAVGLVLMLVGYQAMNYVPLTPRQAEQEQALNQLREMAGKGQADNPTARPLADRLQEIAPPPWRRAPYEIPGRLAVFGGLCLFIAAGVLMYRQKPPRVEQPAEEESVSDD